jgi:hypothetical protein
MAEKNILLQEEIVLINQYLPRGGLWDAKQDDNSNLRAIVVALSIVINQLRAVIVNNTNELNIFLTNEMISEWEVYVGIPDEIFTTISQNRDARIQNILFKLIGLKVKSRPEIIRVIKMLFNTDISFKQSSSLGFTYKFPIILGDRNTDNFRTIITIKQTKNGFTYKFPIILGADFKPIESVIRSIIDFDKIGFVSFRYSDNI